MNIGERIKEFRTNMGVTARATAEALGVPYTTYHNWEAGIREPNLETVAKIATHLGVSVDYLLGIDNVDDDLLDLQFLLNQLTDEGVEKLLEYGEMLREWQSRKR